MNNRNKTKEDFIQEAARMNRHSNKDGFRSALLELGAFVYATEYRAPVRDQRQERTP